MAAAAISMWIRFRFIFYIEIYICDVFFMFIFLLQEKNLKIPVDHRLHVVPKSMNAQQPRSNERTYGTSRLCDAITPRKIFQGVVIILGLFCNLRRLTRLLLLLLLLRLLLLLSALPVLSALVGLTSREFFASSSESGLVSRGGLGGGKSSVKLLS
jgi:hypothetical protein